MTAGPVFGMPHQKKVSRRGPRSQSSTATARQSRRRVNLDEVSVITTASDLHQEERNEAGDDAALFLDQKHFSSQ